MSEYIIARLTSGKPETKCNMSGQHQKCWLLTRNPFTHFLLLLLSGEFFQSFFLVLFCDIEKMPT